MSEKARAVIYARFSSHNQREVSIEQQVDDCKIFAASNDLEVVEVYSDAALTGKNDKRPAFNRMIRDAAKGRWEYVITWKTDRFARNRYDSATYKYKLRKNGVRVLYAKENIPDGPEGILLESVLEGSAEYYSASLSQNILRGMKWNAERCMVNSGSLPLGYKKGADGRYEIEPAGASVVREIFAAVASGRSYTEISEELNGRGVTTKKGGRWNKNSFHSMLANETYIGVYHFSDTRIEGGVPAIISNEEWAEVRKRLSTMEKAQGHRRQAAEFLLTGKLFCGYCEDRMTGISGTSKTKSIHYYYICRTKRDSDNCKKKNVPRDWLESLVVTETLRRVLRDEVIEEIADAAIEYQEREKDDSVLRQLETDLTETRRALSNLLSAVEQGLYTPTTKARMEELEAQRSRLEVAIDDERQQLPDVTREQIVFWLHKFRGGDEHDPVFRSRLVDTFISAIYLYDDHMRIVYNYTGKSNTVTLQIAELAGSAAGAAEGSTLLSSSPPMGY